MRVLMGGDAGGPARLARLLCLLQARPRAWRTALQGMPRAQGLGLGDPRAWRACSTCCRHECGHGVLFLQGMPRH